MSQESKLTDLLTGTMSRRRLVGRSAVAVGAIAAVGVAGSQLVMASQGTATPLEAGDLIVGVNNIPTPDAAAFDQAIASLGRVRLRLNVIRGMDTGFIDVAPRK